MAADNNTLQLYRYLSPLAFLYGIGVGIRNRLFDWGLLQSESFDVPVICVGNLAVGGTGKTPHTEYIIRLLQGRYRIAVLSRGYKRKTEGFVLAHPGSTSIEIGDEPYQMWRKFPDVTLAVDANRRRGIRQLLDLPEAIRPEVILLDDAFQHRYVRPSLRVVLTDYHRLYFRDKLLPVGRLREPISGIQRADVIIVTKCESDIQPAEFHSIEKEMQLKPSQDVFFSRIVYGDLEPVFPGEATPKSLREISREQEILLVSGIAHPEYILKEIRKYTDLVTSLVFPDHHSFEKEDIQKIQNSFDQQSSTEKIIIVTEKDAARLQDNPFLPREWRTRLYQLPITIDFLDQQKKVFDELIRNHIISVKNNRITR